MALKRYDAVVVGAGPNGLSAAIVLAHAGLSVLVREATDEIGGGARSAELTLPGFVHDVCSSAYPLGIGSPFFRHLPLRQHGLEWVQPPIPVAHPFDDRPPALLERAEGASVSGVGGDAAAWRRLMAPFVPRWQTLLAEVLGPLHVPRHPLLLAAFGVPALMPAAWLARRLFAEPPARALFGGIAGHATLQLSEPPSAAFGLILGIPGHVVGWPLARGGGGSISAALGSYLRSLGGDVQTGAPVESLDELPPARAVMLDLTPRQMLRLGGTAFPAPYRAQLERFQYGLGTFKVDWALDAPIPWRDPACARAGTLHLGGTLEELEDSRAVEWSGQPAMQPFVLLGQPSLFDPSRAPDGKHTAWGYCHLPNGSDVDMTDRIEAQVERFAPGFRARILARHTMGPADLERHNANVVGGDINGGEANLMQLFLRPAMRPVPYSTPMPNVFICSSSTPPGGGVHGMSGYHAAQVALRRRFGATARRRSLVAAGA